MTQLTRQLLLFFLRELGLAKAWLSNMSFYVSLSVIPRGSPVKWSQKGFVGHSCVRTCDPGVVLVFVVASDKLVSGAMHTVILWRKAVCRLLGPPVVPFYPFFGEGSPTTKIDYRKKGALILSSLLEDLVA